MTRRLVVTGTRHGRADVWQALDEHVESCWPLVPERERRVVEAVDRESARWRRSVNFWGRLLRMSREEE